MQVYSIDIFCDVVDNYGDAGVSYRLARSLIKVFPDIKIRLFTNDIRVFSKINKGIINSSVYHVLQNIEYFSYSMLTERFVKHYPPADLIIEAFACQIPENYYQEALKTSSVIINLDHLSAEKWIEGVHLKESLTGSKARKYFFMPGFSKGSGGLILDREVNDEEKKKLREEFCEYFELEGDGSIGTVFTYEHDFRNFIRDIIDYNRKTELIIFGEKSKNSLMPLLKEMNFSVLKEILYHKGNIKIVFSGFLSQEKYDDLLKVTDFNFVRGEDSWARACLSGKPFIWHSYFQKDNYQLVKVIAFNELLKRYYTNEELYLKFSEYHLSFNDRTEGKEDSSFIYFLENITEIEANNTELSDYLIKNCNLIENLLFFVGSLKELKKLI